MTTQAEKTLLRDLAKGTRWYPHLSTTFTDSERAWYFIHQAASGLEHLDRLTNPYVVERVLRDAIAHLYDAINLLAKPAEMKVEFVDELVEFEEPAHQAGQEGDDEEPFDRSHNVE